MEIIERIKHNHGLMMILCCLVPLVLLFIAVKYFGLNGSYLFWLVLLLCPLSHYFMMKHMHSEKGKETEKDGQHHQHKDGNGGCH
mgnify:CR=1 FL=1